MGGHRKTIRRKKPLTFIETKAVKRRDAIRTLHTQMKSSDKDPSIPLAIYQNASSKGQTIHRGGDSSKILIEWLKNESVEELRVLEVGCLEVENAIGKYVISHHGSIRRIDLKSRDPRIEEQDFMTLEMPEKKFNLISLSLVLNFVPTPQGRYAMLQRTTQFLRQSTHSIFPALFLVLPLPCVDNSRYLTREHLSSIMASLGYTLIHSKESKRIAYWLYRWTGPIQEKTWKKKVINEGGGKNNFAISN